MFFASHARAAGPLAGDVTNGIAAALHLVERTVDSELAEATPTAWTTPEPRSR